MAQKKGLAIAGMVLGILTIILFFTGLFAIICAIVGIVLSIIALKKANKEPKDYGGKGMALAGIICGAIGLLLAIIVLIIIIAVITGFGQIFSTLPTYR